MPAGQLYPGKALSEAPVVQDALFTYTRGLASVTPQVATPAVGASASFVTNTTGINVFAFVSGGTVSALRVAASGGGTITTGLTSGMIYVPAGAAISATYTAAPSWTWQAM